MIRFEIGDDVKILTGIHEGKDGTVIKLDRLEGVIVAVNDCELYYFPSELEHK